MTGSAALGEKPSVPTGGSRAGRLDIDTIERVAVEVRQQIAPGVSLLDSVPLVAMRSRVIIDGLCGAYRVEGARMVALPRHIWAVTCFSGDRAMVWFHRHAWDELASGVERTRWSAGHEAGHVALHAQALTRSDEAHETPALEREADRFCAHLLAPNAALHRLWINGQRPDPAAIARRFGCSVRAAEKRLAEFVATA